MDGQIETVWVCKSPVCRLYNVVAEPESIIDGPTRIEGIARAFHEAYERLAPEHGYETRESSAVPWEDVPEANKALMRAVVAELLREAVIA